MERAHLVAGERLDERVGRALEGDHQPVAIDGRLAHAGQAPGARRPAGGCRRTRPRAAGPRSPAGSRASRRRRAGPAQDRDPLRDALDLRRACARRGRRSGPARATSRSSAWKLCWTSGSRPAIGSSRISSSGSCMNAWIRPSFWRLPVESSRTGRSSCASKRSASASRTRRSTPPRSVGEVVEHGVAGQLRIQREIARAGSRRAGGSRGCRCWLSRPEQLRRAAGRRDQVEQQPHRRRLAGAVRAEEAEDLAALDLEVEVEEAVPGAVVLREARWCGWHDAQ